MSLKDKVMNFVALVLFTTNALWDKCTALGMTYAGRLLNDRRGEATATKVVGLFIGIFLFALLMPISYNQIYNTNTTGWDETTKLVFFLVPLISIVVFIVGMIYSIVKD